MPGTQPGCTKDSITLYDGHSLQSTSHGPYCGSVASGIIRMSSNFAKIVFHAGTEHNSIHKGAQCTFRSVDAPTPPPPTTPPPSQCGGKLNTASGSFQSPNWPETYPIDIDCEWIIELPDSSKRVEIRCEENPFGIAGSFPSCTKDHLKIYDGHSTQDTLTGTYCHFTRPRAMTMSTNLAMAVFHAGPAHSPTRRGFRCTFQSVTPPTRPPRSTTPPPATPPPTPASQCGGTLTAASGSIESPNWPETYPVDVDCVWTIELPDPSKRIELTFEAGFGLAGRLPSCTKDHLHVHDENTGTVYGPFCHYAIPNVPVMSSNRARLVLHAGPAHNPSRQGFKANYVSV